ncbi:hypothetical protein [Sphingomonas sanxanigenens]|uniref:hypothetical protein n=1 Tax=Sphingomonas sanxanigenens TaxID=397260 RepID=UPI003CCB770E
MDHGVGAHQRGAGQIVAEVDRRAVPFLLGQGQHVRRYIAHRTDRLGQLRARIFGHGDRCAAAAANHQSQRLRRWVDHGGERRIARRHQRSGRGKARAGAAELAQ